MLHSGRPVAAFLVLLSAYVIFCLSLAAGAAAAEARDDGAFTIGDYFNVKWIVELSLSEDGEMIAYVTMSKSLDENRSVRAVYVGKTASNGRTRPIEGIQDAHGVSWIPGRSELAFLSDRSGTTQVYAYNVATKSVRQLTKSTEPIVQFGFAPDGKSLAYITREIAAPTLYSRFHAGKKGVLVNPEVLRVQHFLDPKIGDEHSRMRHLWLLREDEVARIQIPGSVNDFHWASNSDKLSVTYSMPSASLLSLLQKGVGIYDLDHDHFRILVASTPPQSDGSGRGYAGDRWLPGEDKLILLRYKLAYWYADYTHPDWTIVNVSSSRAFAEQSQFWREISLTGSDSAPLFHPLANHKLLINNTLRGGYRTIYNVAESGTQTRVPQRSNVAGDISGNISMIRITARGEKAVFVNDSLSEPPEIYVWRKKGSIRLTNLNSGLAKRRMPFAQEVNWKSKDGTQILGWLLLPRNPEPGQAPWPLVTFIHGGPTQAMRVGFAGYFRTWPYPFEVYALNGLAVFLPNYRGNASFGRPFVTPDRQDGEPVDDIVSGIEHLIRRGVADPNRLAISGHSHGAWLGPMVMTRTQMFQAGSFAEGWGNSVMGYDIAPGSQTRAINDVVHGVSLYDNPERYLELSPSLHFKGLTTAVLFEAGARALPIHMMGYPKAAKYAGMPTEFIIYPKTGHNPTVPTIQQESAERNLDWFRFWLLDEEDPSPSKDAQYRRWRKMRDTLKADKIEKGFFGEGSNHAKTKGRFTQSGANR